MSTHPSSSIARVGLPVALILGVAAAGWLFARSQPMPQAPPTEDVQVARAKAAHEAAGVEVGTGSRDPNSVLSKRVSDLEALVHEHPSDPALLGRLARLLHDGHREAQAIPWYERAMAAAPDDASLVFDLAAAHSAIGDWETAASVLEARRSRVPEDATVLYNLGAVRANQGDTADALRYFRDALGKTTDPDLSERASSAIARLGGA